MAPVAPGVMAREHERAHRPHRRRPTRSATARPPPLRPSGACACRRRGCERTRRCAARHRPTRSAGNRPRGQLLVMHGDRARHEQRRPAGVGQAPAEVDLVGVHEEPGVHPADFKRRRAPHQHGGRLHPHAPRPRPGSGPSPTGARTRLRQRRRHRREAPRRRLCASVGPAQRGPRHRGARLGLERRKAPRWPQAPAPRHRRAAGNSAPGRARSARWRSQACPGAGTRR